MTTKREATIEDLYNLRYEGKAKLVGGDIVLSGPTGDLPSRAGGNIFVSLRLCEGKVKGLAYVGNAGFIVNLPARQLFSPDVAFYIGARSGGKFLQGAPVFAAEVRSDGDYGPAMEDERAEKRADYFAAGILVVWDVDLLKQQVVRVYRHDDPENPTIYRRGDIAEAEPAVPGWRMAVEELFA